MSGFIGDLSPKQEEKLQKFKERVKDVCTKPEHDDYFHTRWLRARAYDVDKAETMLRNHFETRKKMKLDTIIEDFVDPEVLLKYYPGGMVGEDREGAPVWIDNIGQIDPKGLFRSARSKDIIGSRIRNIEYLWRDVCPEMSKKYGHRVEGMVMIMDLEGLGTKHLWKPGVDLFNKFVTLFQDNYPETAKAIFVVRAPRIFPAIFSLIKPFLDERTRKKIHVLGKNFKEYLNKYIAPENLPVHWGGTMTDPETGDPKCPSIVKPGGIVPESYYNQEPVIPDDANLTKQVVKHGQKFDLNYTVDIPGSAIRYIFKTEEGDIGLQVMVQTGTMAMKTVQALEKHNSHLVYEDGSFTCDEPGKYILRFDNSHSWTKNKTLHYFCEVINPDDIKEEETHL
ncbi:SEC14-like protein 2 [Glandiceps talaboti]